jgi:hypothetical protein
VTHETCAKLQSSNSCRDLLINENCRPIKMPPQKLMWLNKKRANLSHAHCQQINFVELELCVFVPYDSQNDVRNSMIIVGAINLHFLFYCFSIALLCSLHSFGLVRRRHAFTHVKAIEIKLPRCVHHCRDLFISSTTAVTLRVLDKHKRSFLFFLTAILWKRWDDDI